MWLERARMDYNGPCFVFVKSQGHFAQGDRANLVCARNNGPEGMCLSDQSMASNPHAGQAKRCGAMTTSRGSKAGHVMTQMCQPSNADAKGTVFLPTGKCKTVSL